MMTLFPFASVARTFANPRHRDRYSRNRHVNRYFGPLPEEVELRWPREPDPSND